MFPLTRYVPRLLSLGSRAQCSRNIGISLVRHTAENLNVETAPTSEDRVLGMNIDWPEAIKNFLRRENIEKPTIIQEKTLPLAMEKKDIVGIARTGSGKTLAFVIPAIMNILKQRGNGDVDQGVSSSFFSDEQSLSRTKRKLPTCLVLAPTRELATQTADVFKKFRSIGIRSAVLVGGASRIDQMRVLRDQELNVYIATPGRLLDLMESQLVDLSGIKYLVFDEADRMLDMGFEPQIRRIVSDIPKDRQTLMWSATWPEEIQALAEDFMTDYHRIAIDSEKLKANPNIRQVVKVCEPYEKPKLLFESLAQISEECENPRTLIFVNTKRLADQLLIQLMRQKFKAITMHGDKTQRQRDDALRLFKNKSCNILIATDVAARGLDIQDITHIINYDLPTNVEDYIHRIGRTARHEKSGTSISLVTTDADGKIVGKLIKVLQETDQEIPERLKELQKNQHLVRRETNRGRIRNNFYTRRTSEDGYDRQNSNRRLNIFDT